MSAQTFEKAQLVWMRSGDREGSAAIFDGHGHDAEHVALMAEPVVGPGPYDVHEAWMHYTPRVKWCERIDGWGCEENGEWHGHWSETQRNPFHPESGAVSVVFPLEVGEPA